MEFNTSVSKSRTPGASKILITTRYNNVDEFGDPIQAPRFNGRNNADQSAEVYLTLVLEDAVALIDQLHWGIVEVQRDQEAVVV